MSLEKVFRQIDANHDEYIRRCQELLRQPSVSGDREDVYRCAEMVRDMIRETGAQAELLKVEGEGNPIVYGTLLSPGMHHTLAAYQMYDTQPIGELDKWVNPPFEAKIVDGKIVARGAINSKGALVAELMAIKTLQETVGVPVNIVFTFDGEEEVGSWQLRRFLKEHPEKMLNAEAEWCPSTFSTAYRHSHHPRRERVHRPPTRLRPQPGPRPQQLRSRRR
jgi:acetylornithine deacetylase/succinyl-diaminopimelate desuccinylase-like protein